mmetsp:Transcript_559/g.1440  ORF Transcript_559/g.1440 Transcript_559/m.1440 type:complete len:91 (+) Transcript_559:270-542(+)
MRASNQLVAHTFLRLVAPHQLGFTAADRCCDPTAHEQKHERGRRVGPLPHFYQITGSCSSAAPPATPSRNRSTAAAAALISCCTWSSSSP